MKNKLDNAQDVLANRGPSFDAMKPYIGKDGGFYINQHKGGDRNDISNFQKVPVNNATLRYDEWRTLDDAVLSIAEQRLVGYDDLTSRGLVYSLNNPMATTVLTWEEMSDAMEAFISIDPVRRGDNDAVVHRTKHIPIPIVHVDYQISERLLQESRNRGNGLDVSNAERAARKVAEFQEDMLFGSTATLTYGGGTIHSYISSPTKNTVSFTSAGEYWDAVAKTGPQIKDDVLAMKQALINDKHYGPYMIYIPTDYETKLDDDYDVSGASLKTIRERILEINSIIDIKVVDRLAADTVLMVQMTSDVVDIIDGMPMQNVEWNSEGGFVHHYKVMTIQIPRIKTDYNDTSGICVLS